nr:reverse transcriptase domain-containing protein [Tanacetum cinerariifolium]
AASDAGPSRSCITGSFPLPTVFSTADVGWLGADYSGLLMLSKRANTFFLLLPSLLNTPPSFNLCLSGLDLSRLILENTLGLGLGLQERLNLFIFSCSLVFMIFDSEYHDVPKHPSKLSRAFSSFSFSLFSFSRLNFSAMIGNVRVWFYDLSPESIDNYDDLEKAFLKKYVQQKKYIEDPIELYNIKQQDGEST